MGRTLHRRAYLVSAAGGLQGEQVYAVLEATEAAARLAAVKALDCDEAQVSVVGGMSRDMTRTLRLKLGEVRKV